MFDVVDDCGTVVQRLQMGEWEWAARGLQWNQSATSAWRTAPTYNPSSRGCYHSVTTQRHSNYLQKITNVSET